MKLSLLLSAASLAAAFVVPDEKILAALTTEDPISDASSAQQLLHEHQHDAHQGGFPSSWSTSSITDGILELSKELEGVDDIVSPGFDKWRHALQKTKDKAAKDSLQPNSALDKIKDGWNDIFDPPKFHPPPYGGLPAEDDEPHLGGGHHKKPNYTIYDAISRSKHTRIFSKIIDEFDEVVDYLNSTEANYTVFVPVDAAFKKFKHHPRPPAEFVLKWLEYHISPEVYTRRTFFSAQTVPTLLKQENDGSNPQRISTAVGLRGLTLNFHSHVVRSNIFAANGVIHGLDEILFPPFSTVDTIDIVPSLFSTLNLGLVKTGLVDLLGPDTPKSGGTLFAPTNQAFAKLGPKINGFLFSRFGQKYLEALLKYHIVANHTLFSDVHYKPEGESDLGLFDHHHVDLPSLFHGRNLSIDIRHFHRFARFTVNKHTKVAISNVPVKEGVIHLVPSVIIPPRKHKHHSTDSQVEDVLPYGPKDQDHLENEPDLTLEELIERLEPYVE